jgi:2-oxo-3-hexenedioate decarboxylase
VSTFDSKALAAELMAARASCQTVPLPSSRYTDFDLDAAYAVEAELVRLRRERGRTTVGLKVGFANRAMWRALKLETLVWAHMYDDTVLYADDGIATLSLAQMCSPKIEPEIVFRMRRPLEADVSDPADVLDAVEWLALGFEIIDCVYADWKFQPTDFVASFGMHAGLVVGEPRRIEPAERAALADALADFKANLLKNGQLVAEGSGRNVLRSPALCLGELGSALAGQAGAEPLAAGELVTTGALADSQYIKAGETWMAAAEGLELRQVIVELTG